jgi:hypothetical protein
MGIEIVLAKGEPGKVSPEFGRGTGLTGSLPGAGCSCREPVMLDDHLMCL